MIYSLKSLESIVKEENKFQTIPFFGIASNIKEAKKVFNDFTRKSDRVISLNGKWDFVFTDHVDVQFDSDTLEFNSINVPSCWENEFNLEHKIIQGYQYEMNLNSNVGSSGIYRRKFVIENNNMKRFISFSKISGVLQLFVNEQFVGLTYSSFAEFDITDFVNPGENEIYCVVSKNNRAESANCIERELISGITGDVYLISRPSTYVYDYAFVSTNSGTNKEVKFDILTKGDVDLKVELSIYDGENLKATTTSFIEGNGKATFNINDEFNIFSCEEPKMYQAYATIFNKDDEEIECCKFIIGFSDIKVENGVCKYCDVPLKIKSIDFNSEYDNEGNLLNITRFLKMLNHIKALNANTIKFDMPVDPMFILYSAINGFFVIENLPVSTKYVSNIYGADYQNTLYKEEWYKEALKVKTESVVIRDSKLPSLIFFTANVDSTNCIAYKEAIENASKLTNKLVLNGNNQNTIVDYDNTIKDNKNIWNIISNKENTFFVTNIRPKSNIRLADVDGLISCLLKLDNVIGVSIFGYYKENGENNNENNYLVDSELKNTPQGALIKYAFRPLVAEFVSETCLKITSKYMFKMSDNIKAKIFSGMGPNRTLLGAFAPSIVPQFSKEYDINLPLRDNIKKIYIEYSYVNTNEHIATESLNTIKDDDTVGDKYLEFVSFEYKLNKKSFNISDISENILPPRAFFIPNSNKRVCDKAGRAEGKYKSDRLFRLSTDWDIAYFENGAPETFNPQNLSFTKSCLPNSWESLGFEKHRLIDGYPFKTDFKKYTFAEKDGNKNSACVYRRLVSIADLNFNYILTFEKVNGTIELQVNGQYVGFSTIGFAEFDISKFLVAGINEIVVIVTKWCPTSYLQVNKGFIASGIIGDVYFTKTRESSLFDVEYDASKDVDDFYVNVDLKFFKANGQTVLVELNDKDKNLYTRCIKNINTSEIELPISYGFKPYNIETKKTYQLYIKIFENKLLTECTKIIVGFNSVKLQADLLSINDDDIKISGIEYNPIYNADGALLTQEDYQKDFEQIKEYGFNTIRPTGYISQDALDCCFESTGLYIIKDLGFNTILQSADAKSKYNVIKNPAFDATIETISNYTYSRVKNNPAVICYYFNESLNESPIGKIAKDLREFTFRPIIALEGETTDILVSSNKGVEETKTILEKNIGIKPVLISGYGYSTGLGDTHIKDFYLAIESNSCCVGGIIHQFVDDVVSKSGNVTDGIFNEYRKPYPVAEYVKYLFRPITSTVNETFERITFTNRNFTRNASYLYADLCTFRNGKQLDRVRLNLNVSPRSSKAYDYIVDSIEGDMYLNIEFYDVETKKLVYTDQHILNKEIVKINSMQGYNPIRMSTMFDYLDVDFECGNIRFNRNTGKVIKYTILDKEIIFTESGLNSIEGIRTNLNRPFIRNLNEEKEYNFVLTKLETNYEKNVKMYSLIINEEFDVNVNKKKAFKLFTKYVINANGVVEVFNNMKAINKGEPFEIDNFGMKLKLNKSFGNVTYYGKGNSGSYADLETNDTMGIHTMYVDRMFDLIKIPQECGNRENVHFAVITDNDGDGVAINAINETFNLKVMPCSDKEIKEKFNAKEEQTKVNGVYVDIASDVSGIGDDKQFVLNKNEYNLAYKIIPVTKIEK